MKLLNTALILALATLVGCASNLGYKAAQDDEAYGYSDEALDEQRYRVAFNGKRMLRNERLADYTIRRAAEVTLENGYDWFRVANPFDTVGAVAPDATPRFVRTQSPHGPGSEFGLRQQIVSTLNSAKPDVQMERPLPAIAIEIVMGSGTPPGDALWFDARGVLGIVETT